MKGSLHKSIQQLITTVHTKWPNVIFKSTVVNAVASN